jgi:aspartyl-tRNA synthetase
MNQYRTHTCGALREEHVGQTVTLSGWIETIRDHGGVTFLDLRDQYGITQIVLHSEETVAMISKESVITVSGAVKKRDADTINPKIETGTVEVHAMAVDMQSKAVRALPFEITESHNTREEVRLRHRFLDLRNPAVKKIYCCGQKLPVFYAPKWNRWASRRFKRRF